VHRALDGRYFKWLPGASVKVLGCDSLCTSKCDCSNFVSKGKRMGLASWESSRADAVTRYSRLDGDTSFNDAVKSRSRMLNRIRSCDVVNSITLIYQLSSIDAFYCRNNSNKTLLCRILFFSGFFCVIG
jgi:hypothetical protein